MKHKILKITRIFHRVKCFQPLTTEAFWRKLVNIFTILNNLFSLRFMLDSTSSFHFLCFNFFSSFVLYFVSLSCTNNLHRMFALSFSLSYFCFSASCPISLFSLRDSHPTFAFLCCFFSFSLSPILLVVSHRGLNIY